MPDQPLAIFLTGPIGVGKTTLGRALAAALGGAQIEGDDYQLTGRPWYAASRRVAWSIVEAASAASPSGPVVIGYPLRCIDYLFLRRRLTERGIRTVFVNLAMPAERILADERGRVFTAWERDRIGEMVAEGYNRRPWADLLFEPEDTPVGRNIVRLLAELKSFGIAPRLT